MVGDDNLEKFYWTSEPVGAPESIQMERTSIYMSGRAYVVAFTHSPPQQGNKEDLGWHKPDSYL
jgi:hypothetical protein